MLKVLEVRKHEADSRFVEVVVIDQDGMKQTAVYDPGTDCSRVVSVQARKEMEGASYIASVPGQAESGEVFEEVVRNAARSFLSLERVSGADAAKGSAAGLAGDARQSVAIPVSKSTTISIESPPGVAVEAKVRIEREGDHPASTIEVEGIRLSIQDSTAAASSVKLSVAIGGVLPRENEITTLPQWARVAFAARCARRALPLVKAGWPSAPDEIEQSIDMAITTAELAASDGTGSDSGEAAFDLNLEITAALNVARDAGRAIANDSSRSAADAAIAAAKAAGALQADSVEIAASQTLQAASLMGARDFAASAICRDFHLLREAARREGWTDDTPVPPAFFGPIWPLGTPPGWPVVEESAGDDEIVIDIAVPDEASDEQIEAEVVRIVDLADDLHRAYGGRGLAVKGIEVFADAPKGKGQVI
jgi:hypothetical protein